MKMQELQTVMHTACHRKEILFEFFDVCKYILRKHNIFWPLLPVPCCSAVRKLIQGGVICTPNKKGSYHNVHSSGPPIFLELAVFIMLG